MAFYVGQKVVCVDDKPRVVNGKRGLPVLEIKEGRVYTVTAFSVDSVTHAETVKIAEHPVGTGFYPDRFRPAVEPNIQQFRDLVAPIFDKPKRAPSPVGA